MAYRLPIAEDPAPTTEPTGSCHDCRHFETGTTPIPFLIHGNEEAWSHVFAPIYIRCKSTEKLTHFYRIKKAEPFTTKDDCTLWQPKPPTLRERLLHLVRRSPKNAP